MEPNEDGFKKFAGNYLFYGRIGGHDFRWSLFRLLRIFRSNVSNLGGEPRSLTAAQVLVAPFFLKLRMKLALFCLKTLVQSFAELQSDRAGVADKVRNARCWWTAYPERLVALPRFGLVLIIFQTPNAGKGRIFFTMGFVERHVPKKISACS